MKNKIIEQVQVIDMAATGKAVAKIDGQVIFIEKAVPGDLVDIKIVRSKKSFLEAKVVKFHEYSKDRIEAKCDYFGVCGGCKWQNIDYQTQLNFKQRQVTENLKRIGKINPEEINEITPSATQFQYRNKLEYTFTNYRWLSLEEIQSEAELNRNGVGFHIPGFYDRVVDVKTCHLQVDISNSIRNEVRSYALEHDLSFYNVKKHTGLLRNLIIRTTAGGQIMVILQIGDDDSEAALKILSHLHTTFTDITSLFYVINLKGNDDYSDQEMIHAFGESQIEELMEDPNGNGTIRFRISPKSFYQTNSQQAEQLYKLAWKLADFQGDELVYDLYTGTGTIACYVASSAKKVVGVEYVADAVLDANKNAEYNNITNTDFYTGDMKDVLSDEFVEENGTPDIIITDPPRAGMHKDVTLKLLELNPRKIVYISCNPATQARDIELLSERYNVTTVQPVDMFPHTPHVENIVLLESK